MQWNPVQGWPEARTFDIEDWPEKPSLRFLVHWGLRKDELCDRKIGCPHEDSGIPCPLDALESAQQSEEGRLLRRAMSMKQALNRRIAVPLDEIPADEYLAMDVIEEEVAKFEDEKNKER